MLNLENLLQIICQNLQIAQPQYTLAKEKYEEIQRKLQRVGSPFSTYNLEIFPQGSFAIQTTVKPLSREEYDVDLVCLLKDGATASINPMNLLTELKSFLVKLYGTSNVELKKRCVCVNFSRQFHLDILPAIPDPLCAGDNLLIPDREIKAWTSSNPRGYRKWFLKQCERRVLTSSKNESLPRRPSVYTQSPLQNTVQLFKRWRDIAFKGMNENWQPRSIVLTTLLANAYQGENTILTTFSSALNDIKQKIDSHTSPLAVLNPLDSNECFSEKWYEDQEGYFHFRSQLAALVQDFTSLQNATSLTDKKEILSRLFGESIVNKALTTVAKGIASPETARNLRVTNTGELTTAMANTLAVPKHTFYGN